MGGLFIFIWIWISIFLIYAWHWIRRSRFPKDFKSSCICGHRKSTHFKGKCDACECPEFILTKKPKKGDVYWLRKEGPTTKIIHVFSRSMTIILVAFVPRHILWDWIHRVQRWLDKQYQEDKES